MSAGAPRGRIEWRNVDGILLLDKPLHLSSNQALQRARRLFRARKAGHTGSLDPLASGVLPLCFGQATKVAGLLLDSDKRYQATISFGARTATGDREGEVIETRPIPALERPTVAAALERFVGEGEQVPPMYSALKRDGEPLYALARRGIEVARAPRRITIHALSLVELTATSLSIELRCTKGTYVRTLGEDLALALGTCGHLSALRRTGVGAFDGYALYDFAALEALAGDEPALDRCLLPVDAALSALAPISLTEAAAGAFRHGQRLAWPAPAGARVRVYDASGTFIGIGHVDATGSEVSPDRLMSTGPA